MSYDISTRDLLVCIVLSCSIILTVGGQSVEDKIQQLEQNYIKIKQDFETEVIRLEDKVNDLQGRLEQHQPPIAPEEDNNFGADLPAFLPTKMPRTCFEMKTADLALNTPHESGIRWIDPDGDDGEGPIHVHCDLETGITYVSHDAESTIDVAKCSEPGCYSRAINYGDTTINQMSVLAQLSGECHQSITYDCTDAPLHFNGVHFSWWNDRHGNPQYFWSGNKTDAHICQCGIDGNCIEPSMPCNCDSLLPTFSNDTVITDKEMLPITSMHFGRTKFERSSGAHTLGKFVCSGGDVNANQGPRQFNQMPASCQEIKLLGHTLNGLYAVLRNSAVETVYCDFTREIIAEQEVLLPIDQKSITSSYLQQELDGISKRFAENTLAQIVEMKNRVVELATKLTDTNVQMAETNKVVNKLEEKLTEEMERVKQETAKSCCNVKSEDLPTKLPNPTIPGISKPTTKLDDLESIIEHKLETTKIELAKTSTELIKMDTLVNDLATKLNERTSDIVDIVTMPTGCCDLQKMGHKISGVYMVMDSRKVKTVYCNFIPSNGIRLETFIGYADVKSALPSPPSRFFVQRLAD